MDVGRSPGVRMVLPGISTRTDRQEAVDPFNIRQTAAHAQEVRIERPRPLIPFVEVTPSGIGLPDLQKGVRHWIATVVQHAAGHDDALANGLAAGPGVACKIGVFWCDGTDGGSGSCQLRECQWLINERKRRSPASRGLIGLIQIGREHLSIPPNDFADSDMVHASCLPCCTQMYSVAVN